jgi:hypothetical protein
MHTIPVNSVQPSGSKAPQVASMPVSQNESKSERVDRLYRHKAGPLIGWMFDECRIRGSEIQDLARELSVTTGYLNQLGNGVKKTQDLSHEMCVACARYLHVPAIAVKLVAGVIRMGDFLHPSESEEHAVERAIRHIMGDAQIKKAVPANLAELPFEAKKAIALMYVEVSSQDIFHLQDLPSIVHWLQRAAVGHDESEYAAIAGHRDTSVRL